MPRSIVMMENHDMAYHAWKERGVVARTLIHVDAHIDFGWIPETDLDEIGIGGKGPKAPLLNPFMVTRKKMLNIGNYICPAMRDGMVEKFYWVVPDESWSRPRGVKLIVKQLRRILRIKSYAGRELELHRDYIRCRILGKEVIVCSLENLGRIEEPALLDIDVDFMLTRSIWDDLNPERVPWIYPEELFEKLSTKVKNIDVLTISYSVEGGFTPLRFKYLGDELRSLFAQDMDDGKRKAMQCKRSAVTYEKEAKYAEAIAAYEEALDIDGEDASAYFNLSLLYLNGCVEGAAGKARGFLDDAVKKDNSYATAYNNYGILYLRYNRPKRAEAEYKKFLRVNGETAAVLNSLGHIALAGKRYIQAEGFFSRCLSIDKSYPAARLGKAITDLKTGKARESEELLSRLKEDLPDDHEIHWWLGRIAERRGDAPLAISSYKNAVMLGGEGPFVHLRLSRLYMAKGFYRRTFEELKRFFFMLNGTFWQ